MPRVGRNREKNKRFPKGWMVSSSGILYFRPTNEADKAIVRAITGGPLCLRLGKTHDEAAETYARTVVATRNKTKDAAAGTVAELISRARLEFIPTIANKKTRKERERHIDMLEEKFASRRYARNVFEASRDFSGGMLRAMDVQRHLFDCKGTRPVAANREVRTWELVFTWARAPWGLTEYNPCSGLLMNEEKPRDVLPADEDIFKLYRWLDPPARFMVALNRYYGRRKVESLGLQLQSVQVDGLHLRRGKRKKEIVILWDRRLRRMVDRAILWREKVIRPTKGKREGPRVVSTALLINRRGRAYTETGFNSARRRAMECANIKGAFTFHDIRGARASTLPPEKAVEVLAHDDPRTTHRIYRRGAHVVDLTEEANSRKPPDKAEEVRTNTSPAI